MCLEAYILYLNFKNKISGCNPCLLFLLHLPLAHYTTATMPFYKPFIELISAASRALISFV